MPRAFLKISIHFPLNTSLSVLPFFFSAHPSSLSCPAAFSNTSGGERGGKGGINTDFRHARKQFGLGKVNSVGSEQLCPPIIL